MENIKLDLSILLSRSYFNSMKLAWSGGSGRPSQLPGHCARQTEPSEQTGNGTTSNPLQLPSALTHRVAPALNSQILNEASFKVSKITTKSALVK